MNSQQNSQDEGFIATKLVAKVSEKDEIRDSKGKQCKIFSPFYLPPGHGAMRVQIPEAVQEFDEFLIEQEIQARKYSDMSQQIGKSIKRNNSLSVTPQHPYRFYEQNSMFELVYSKNSSDEPLNNEFQYIILQTSDMRETNGGDCEKKTKVVNMLRNPYSRLLRSFDSTALNPMPRNFSNKSQTSKTYSQLLNFDSRFQCGNLYCVYHKIGTNEYHLFLQNDTNSYGYNQWFYFSITNAKPSTQYNFVIVNLKKKHSFFKQGYKPIVFSLNKYEENGHKNGWYRTGFNIDYQQSHIMTSKFFKFYKLNFTLNFTQQNDYLLIAANLPYSFTRLSNYLDKFNKNFRISNQTQQQDIATLRISPLGRTFCGNNLPEIKITPKQQENINKSPSKNKKKNNTHKKKMIVFLARQHPGQTVSSYLMENILNQISSFGIETQNPKQKQSKEKIKFLLKNFTILIYPMINIDGVIYGNSRCDVSGMDLNRRWKNPSKVFHPQLFNIKNRLETYSKKYEIVACFDLHGHSKLYNVFCYSCKINPITCRILPFLVSKQTKKFYFPSCTFGITRYKSTTARASIFKIIKNENVLTIESSYFGFVQNKQQQTESSGQLRSSNKNKIIKYFQPKDFQQIAVSLLNGLQIFLNKQEVKKYRQTEKQIRTNLRQIQNYQRQNHQGEQDSGSQSDPEGDQIEFQVKIKTILGKQFLQQASSFLPAEEQNIDIPQTLQPSLTSQPITQNPRLKTTQRQEKIETEIKESSQKIQRSNKIRITKFKQDPKCQKITSNYKIKNDLNIINMNPKPPKTQIKKQKNSTSLYQKIKDTISVPREKNTVSTYQQNTVDKSQRLYSQNNQRSMFGSNKNHSQMRIHDDSLNEVKKSTELPKFYDDLIICSAQSKQALNMQKSNLLENTTSNQPPIFTDNHFFIKFKKFIPSHQIPTFNRKQKLSFLQDSIYKDDQRQILHTLMQNKKRLQKQKTRRQQQKSATIGQKYSIKNSRHKNVWDEEIEAEQKMLRGYGLSDGKRRQEIVDFRKFKDRERAKMQLRQANQVYIKFMKKESLD